MSTPGLSLFGFWPEPRAIEYLNAACWQDDPSPVAMSKFCKEAKARLGDPIERPGQPRFGPIDSSHAKYAGDVEAHGLYQAFVQQFGEDCCALRMVELAPLLAVQPHVEIERSKKATGKPASTRQLLEKCLPIDAMEIPLKAERDGTGHGMVVRVADMNVETRPGLAIKDADGNVVIGPGIGLRHPFVQVMRAEGKCYLRNGYHRAAELLRQGIDFAPCIFIDHQRFQQLQIGGFERSVLEQEHPPLVGYFAGERPTSVTLKTVTNVIAVTWTQFLLTEQDAPHLT